MSTCHKALSVRNAGKESCSSKQQEPFIYIVWCFNMEQYDIYMASYG